MDRCFSVIRTKAAADINVLFEAFLDLDLNRINVKEISLTWSNTSWEEPDLCPVCVVYKLSPVWDEMIWGVATVSRWNKTLIDLLLFLEICVWLCLCTFVFIFSHSFLFLFKFGTVVYLNCFIVIFTVCTFDPDISSHSILECVLLGWQ